MQNSRREFIRKTALVAASGALLGSSLQVFGEEAGPLDNTFNLPPLPYAHDALEPFIDKLTMEIHHTKHHQAYVTNLNKALTDNNIEVKSLEELMAEISKYPAAVRNNGGGHWNHTFFWESMRPGGGGVPEGRVAEAINQSFGSFDEFKKLINEAGMKRFGSGWSWLVKSKEGKLIIGSTPNQDNPLMDVAELKGQPILGIDVWEHAYYLKYQNKRGDYLSAWWNVVNWDKVAERL
jgi:Fe-Mn family superoxide dismutase